MYSFVTINYTYIKALRGLKSKLDGTIPHLLHALDNMRIEEVIQPIKGSSPLPMIRYTSEMARERLFSSPWDLAVSQSIAMVYKTMTHVMAALIPFGFKHPEPFNQLDFEEIQEVIRGVQIIFERSANTKALDKDQIRGNKKYYMILKLRSRFNRELYIQLKQYHKTRESELQKSDPPELYDMVKDVLFSSPVFMPLEQLQLNPKIVIEDLD